ncbi:hypothetical protein H9X96_20140 [Pedobacter sp. N36a]|uniref:hypothetical protein n=1 Tax=Pedobacter sp. N36a TaxID=2767996 RepID=UPI0016574050|nr:hypothetical protein [Pedobacter sp. N36a]MBC8988071.1 hypothetical protein [Pedobacter sp. N36a]
MTTVIDLGDGKIIGLGIKQKGKINDTVIPAFMMAQSGLGINQELILNKVSAWTTQWQRTSLRH